VPLARRLVFAGEAIVDVVMRVPGLPERGGDVLATGSEVTVGGGLNVMAAAARQDMPVLYAGGHGTGPWGDLVRAALAAEGIGVLRHPDPARDTGFDVALVEPDGERTFVTHTGAEIPDLESWDVPVRDGDLAYISGYGLAPAGSGPILGEWAAALPGGVLLFLDPGPLAGEIPEAVLAPVLARCDWLSCNEREAAVLSGVSDAASAARLLRERTARAQVIVRTGAAGCILAAAAVSRIPAPEVRAVDTTGAGDAHAGVFLAGLAGGLSPARAAARANAAAALSVTRPGPATAPGRAELDQWIAQRGCR
jgi:sugar/nucleoside kinase (ribokinase family)